MRKPNKSRVIWVLWGLVGLLGPRCVSGASDHNKQVREELITVLSGENVTIKCTGAAPEDVKWVVKPRVGAGRVVHKQHQEPLHPSIGADGSLEIVNVDAESGNRVYSCYNNSNDVLIKAVRLVVESPPSTVANLTVIPHSVYALVTWTLKDADSAAVEAGRRYPITKFILTYQMVNTHLDHQRVEMVGADAGAWDAVVVDDIPGTSTSKSVYDLRPNSTYSFSLCAVNELGRGPNLTNLADTHYSQQEIEEARRLFIQSKKENLSNLVQVVLIALCVVLIVVCLPGGISLLLCNKGWCSSTTANSVRPDLVCEATEDEEMELVPHITLNPSFNIDMLEYIDPSPEQEFPAGHDDTDNLMAASSSDTRSSMQSQRKHERQKKFPNG